MLGSAWRNRPNAAVTFLAGALILAQPEGFVRTFLDKGEELIPLLRLAASQNIASDNARRLLAEFGAKTTIHAQPSDTVETLSEREIEVLQMLADGQTNQKIARAVFVSIYTVMSHLKSIYGKLGAHNRREAAA